MKIRYFGATWIVKDIRPVHREGNKSSKDCKV